MARPASRTLACPIAATATATGNRRLVMAPRRPLPPPPPLRPPQPPTPPPPPPPAVSISPRRPEPLLSATRRPGVPNYRHYHRHRRPPSLSRRAALRPAALASPVAATITPTCVRRPHRAPPAPALGTGACRHGLPSRRRRYRHRQPSPLSCSAALACPATTDDTGTPRPCRSQSAPASPPPPAP